MSFMVQIFTSLMSTYIIRDYLHIIFASKRKIYSLGVWGVYFVINIFFERNNNITLTNLGIGCVSVLFVSIILFEGSFQKKIVAVVFYHFVWIVVELLLGYIIMVTIGSANYDDYEMLCLVLSKIVMMANIRLFSIFIDKKCKGNIFTGFWFVPTVVSLFSCIMIYTWFLQVVESARDDVVLHSAFSSVLILLLNLLIYYAYGELSRKMDIQREATLYEQQVALYESQMEEREVALLEMQKKKHDMKNHIIYVRELVNKKDYLRLNEFFDSMMADEVFKTNKIIDSDNILIDSIINCKYTLAQHKDISCRHDVTVPYKFGFSDGDICIILGNALDNAIEAAEKCSTDRFIKVSINYNKGNLVISIENSFNGYFIKNYHGKLITTKENPNCHGFGLSSIEKAASKYNGLVDISIDNKIFKITVLLYS